MIDDRNLTKKYKEMQQQKTPDIWNRIESELQPVDRPEDTTQKLSAYQGQETRTAGRFRHRYGWAAAAAIFGVVLIGSRLVIPERDMSETWASATAVAESERSENDTVRQESEVSGVILLETGSLQVPANARTVPYDAGYFSEDILRETDLLCGAVITDVSFVYDDLGNAIYVNYDMTVSDVYYAEDYISGMDEVSVASPIIETDGDEAYLLYQMQIGRHYLLPLTEQQDGWELLYPFAPQIQVLDEQSFKFHSGYTSLITHQTEVTKGISEGENDFYYDRMLIREDGDFLSDLISLVK